MGTVVAAGREGTQSLDLMSRYSEASTGVRRLSLNGPKVATDQLLTLMTHGRKSQSLLSPSSPAAGKTESCTQCSFCGMFHLWQTPIHDARPTPPASSSLLFPGLAPAPPVLMRLSLTHTDSSPGNLLLQEGKVPLLPSPLLHQRWDGCIAWPGLSYLFAGNLPTDYEALKGSRPRV